ncbi:MAG: hypothetical protein GQ477_04320, partial [Nanohaloarchaea archaeon]|nr:hypothetical protein [Candidatus Nanohaloarchaea archaeon]
MLISLIPTASANFWISDSSIVSGLGDVGSRSSPTVYNDSGTWKLISGEDSGVFNGYYWGGSTWTSDSNIVNGLGDVGAHSTPTVYNDGGTWKLISGEDSKVFNGYHWNRSEERRVGRV